MSGRFLARGVALMLAGPALAAAQDLPQSERYRLRVEYTRWSPDLTGDIQKGFGEAPGTLLDLSDDLGVASERTWEVRGTIRFGSRFKLKGAYVPLDRFLGDVNARTNFLYGGEQFFLGERVLTAIDARYYRGEIQWDFQASRQGFVGLLVGAKVFDVSSVVVSPDAGKRVIQDDTLPVPVIGLAGRTYYGRFSVEGEFSGMTLGSRGRVFEMNLYGRLGLSDRLAVGGGYHRVTLEGKDARDSVSIRLGGWSYGIELSL
ncbi:MAG TPA: hypothetical protein VLI67_11490 [Vicinamibacteria bacterium]|nr:hypothetical protein [Vicinamibacteria bacterium]